MHTPDTLILCASRHVLPEVATAVVGKSKALADAVDNTAALLRSVCACLGQSKKLFRRFLGAGRKGKC